MDEELRIKLADHGSPEALAECIVDHYPNIEIPVPVERIGEAVGITEIVGRLTESFEGVLLTDASKTAGSIAFNKASGIARRRFTIAHEIGHFLLPSHGAGAQCAKADMGVLKSADPNRASEAEANRFAAALLMPKKLFVRDVRQLGAPETEHILRLAARYEVSKEACARRYADLSGHTCAVVFSRDGKVRSFYKNGSFPYLDVARDKPLPGNCISSRSRGEAGKMSEWSEIDAEVWIGSSRLRGKVLYEQFFEQEDGYRLTMLTLDEADEDGEDDGGLEDVARRFGR